MLPVNKLKIVLSGRKLLWVGGGYHLAKPTIAASLCGGISFSLDDTVESDTNLKLFINLEGLLPKRPDWNRFTDNQTYDLLPRIHDTKTLKAWSGSLVFPYYVSTYAWRLAEQLGTRVIGNPPLSGESLYLRHNGRSIAEEVAFETPRTRRYRVDNVPEYRQLTEEFNSDRLVLTPPYSDGGAWVYPVNDVKDSQSAVFDIRHNFPDGYIEVSPYYQGISMNLNVCNVVDSKTGQCHVVVFPPSVQIIGEPNLSDGKLRYCGCDFPAASEALEGHDKGKLFSLAAKFGKALFRHYGWKGMFGIDFILRPDGSLIFLEVNPRLQSSTHILDKEIRDENNPMLLQIATFLGADCGIKQDTNLMALPILSSMLVAYNQSDEDLVFVATATQYPGSSGYPSEGKEVAPGGILFRQNVSGRVLDSNFHTLTESWGRIIRNQINTAFRLPDRLISRQSRCGD